MSSHPLLSYDCIISQFSKWAEMSGEVFAAFIIGSRARQNHQADEYSDLDLVLVVEEPSFFLSTSHWLSEIGRYSISFDEYTVGGGRERRVLFDGVLDVDFLLFTKAQFIQCVESPEFLSLFTRGYRVLLDKEGYARSLAEGVGAIPSHPMMTQEEYWNLVNNFWFHTVWAAKKLKRGELWVAKSCVDGYMKGLLLQIIECHAHAMHGHEYETWHGGRFLESWADTEVNEALPGTFGSYEIEDVGRALLDTMELFRGLAREAADALGFRYPEEAERSAREWVINVLHEQ